MKRLFPLLLLPAFLQVAPPPKPEVAAYRARMDRAQDLQDGILDGFESKDAAAVTKKAKELTGLLQEDLRYWEDAKLPQAIDLGQQSVRLSQQLAQDAAGGKLTEASTDNRQLQQTCRACHDAHFEKQVSR